MFLTIVIRELRAILIDSRFWTLSATRARISLTNVVISFTREVDGVYNEALPRVFKYSSSLFSRPFRTSHKIRWSIVCLSSVRNYSLVSHLTNKFWMALRSPSLAWKTTLSISKAILSLIIIICFAPAEPSKLPWFSKLIRNAATNFSISLMSSASRL